MKPVFIIAIVVVVMIGVMVPSSLSTSYSGSETICPDGLSMFWNFVNTEATERGLQMFNVVTNSMVPNILACDIIFVEKTLFEEIQVGDVIAFDRPSDHNKVIVHRVESILSEDPLTIRTKGDANSSFMKGTDYPITKKEYIGKVGGTLNLENICKENEPWACERIKLQKEIMQEYEMKSKQKRWAVDENTQNNFWEEQLKQDLDKKSEKIVIETVVEETVVEETVVEETVVEETVVEETVTIVQESSEEGGGCLIATTTYGSEMSQQVQQLRELRDNQLLQTESGTAFMGTFNDVYYSFSPTIADMEREHPMFKEAVKLAITPMISTLSLMENADSESEVLSIGISVIALNLGMYLGVPAIVVVGIRKKF